MTIMEAKESRILRWMSLVQVPPPSWRVRPQKRPAGSIAPISLNRPTTVTKNSNPRVKYHEPSDNEDELPVKPSKKRRKLVENVSQWDLHPNCPHTDEIRLTATILPSQHAELHAWLMHHREIPAMQLCKVACTRFLSFAPNAETFKLLVNDPIYTNIDTLTLTWSKAIEQSQLINTFTNQAFEGRFANPLASMDTLYWIHECLRLNSQIPPPLTLDSCFKFTALEFAKSHLNAVYDALFYAKYHPNYKFVALFIYTIIWPYLNTAESLESVEPLPGSPLQSGSLYHDVLTNFEHFITETRNSIQGAKDQQQTMKPGAVSLEE